VVVVCSKTIFLPHPLKRREGRLYPPLSRNDLNTAIPSHRPKEEQGKKKRRRFPRKKPQRYNYRREKETKNLMATTSDHKKRQMAGVAIQAERPGKKKIDDHINSPASGGRGENKVSDWEGK